VATLAIIKMIFRGDGRTNIINDDCLTKALIPLSNNGISSAECVSKKDVNAETPRPVTKVLMNPPFSLKKEEEKVHKFITHALEQMDDGGLLFSVLPVSTMIKGGSAKKWRKDVLLKNNTLLSVVTFPIDVFYPSSASITIGIFIKKGKKHPEEQNILWLRAVHDGMAKKKGKRLPFSNIPNDLEKIKPVLQSFINNPLISVENIPEFQKACPMCSLQDKHFELVPEAYLDSKIPISDEVKESMDDLMRESVAYLIRSGKEGEIDNGNY
jgi:type I restriction-modification system DNA methylase subunit